MKIQENKNKKSDKKIKFSQTWLRCFKTKQLGIIHVKYTAKHAKTDPKISTGRKKIFCEHSQNKMFSNGIIHSITTNFKLLLCAAVRPKQCLLPRNKKNVPNLFSNGQKGEKLLRKKIICRNQFVNTSQQNAAHRSEMQILVKNEVVFH